ncbi:MAG: TetR/AcrR family transcriptional regulator [Phycisphaerae bacterium]|nr:TetR/AcrR family transcriptional regulator [Phycisphaerae bacterium]
MASAMEPSRKERERLQHRQEILSAALQLFAEKGFHNVSMQEIATAAQFATGTLYNFFPSKEDLFFELLVATADAGLDLILPVLEGTDDERDKLSLFIRSHERFAREQAVALRLYLLESRGWCLPGPKVEAKKKEIDARVTSRLSNVIAAGIRKGLFNDIDPVVAAKCLSAVLESLILVAAEDPQVVDLPANLEKVEAVFFRGLVNSSGDKRDA